MSHAVQPSLRDSSTLCQRVPSTEVLGYFRLSLRDRRRAPPTSRDNFAGAANGNDEIVTIIRHRLNLSKALNPENSMFERRRPPRYGPCHLSPATKAANTDGGFKLVSLILSGKEF